MSDTVVISWNPPAVEVSGGNLTYCIEVTSVESFLTECDVTETEFEYSLPPMSWCGITIFTIIPVNIAGRGTSSEAVYLPELNGECLVTG